MLRFRALPTQGEATASPSLGAVGAVFGALESELCSGSERSAPRIRTWTSQLQRLSCCRYTKAECAANGTGTVCQTALCRKRTRRTAIHPAAR